MRWIVKWRNTVELPAKRKTDRDPLGPSLCPSSLKKRHLPATTSLSRLVEAMGEVLPLSSKPPCFGVSQEAGLTWWGEDG